MNGASRSVRRFRWSVCHNFLKLIEVTLQAPIGAFITKIRSPNSGFALGYSFSHEWDLRAGGTISHLSDSIQSA